MQTVDKVNDILRHPYFISELGRLAKIEENRAFCGHGIDHLLDVARIAYILNLESGGEYNKELIYAAALLHDTGRARQYEDGTPHERESAAIAAEILPQCGFSDSETAQILEAVLAHRTQSVSGGQGLNALLYSADKLSRRCFECLAIEGCDWSMKNRGLRY